MKIKELDLSSVWPVCESTVLIPGFLEKLLMIVKSPKFLVNVRRGYPTCEICGYSIASKLLDDGPFNESVVLADVVVPSGENLLLFPTLLHHYINAHRFKLPSEFVDAIIKLDVEKINGEEIKCKFNTFSEST